MSLEEAAAVVLRSTTHKHIRQHLNRTKLRPGVGLKRLYILSEAISQVLEVGDRNVEEIVRQVTAVTEADVGDVHVETETIRRHERTGQRHKKSRKMKPKP